MPEDDGSPHTRVLAVDFPASAVSLINTLYCQAAI